MRSLTAAISPGYFGFTDWAFAAEAASEIAVQVPIATRKNNALIIISTHVRSFSRLRSIRSASSAGLVRIKAIETSSGRILASIAASARERWSAAYRRYLLTTPSAVLEPREDATRQVRRQAAGSATGPFVSP
jgi:hypothetical protein